MLNSSNIETAVKLVRQYEHLSKKLKTIQEGVVLRMEFGNELNKISIPDTYQGFARILAEQIIRSQIDETVEAAKAINLNLEEFTNVYD